MSATLSLDLFRPSILDSVEDGKQLRGPRFARDRRQGGGPTLDDVLVGVWEGLAAHRTVACLVCGEAMVPRYGAGPVPVGGRCGGCGTTLA